MGHTAQVEDGMRLDGANLHLDESGRGTLTVRPGTLADYRAVLTHLQSEARLIEPHTGRARRLLLNGPPPAPPSEFPCEVALPVIDRPLPDDDVTQRMAFGNNFLQSGCFVDVISFEPPTENGAEGLLRVHCSTEEKYREVRRFLDEEHGSALKAFDGGIWFIHRVDDDAELDQPFPQNVSVRVEWLRR